MLDVPWRQGQRPRQKPKGGRTRRTSSWLRLENTDGFFKEKEALRTRMTALLSLAPWWSFGSRDTKVQPDRANVTAGKTPMSLGFHEITNKAGLITHGTEEESVSQAGTTHQPRHEKSSPSDAKSSRLNLLSKFACERISLLLDT